MHVALLQQNVPCLVELILGLKQPSGVFAGDAFGEMDTRFFYCAISTLSLSALDHLDRVCTVTYLTSCRNVDGSFGCVASSESHATQGVFSPTPSTRVAHLLY